MKAKAETENGFKETEIGLIPTDWEAVNIDGFVKFQRGSEPGRSNYNKEMKGVRFLRVVDVSGSREDEIYTTVENIKLCTEKDILITLDGSPGIIRKGLSGAYSSGIRKIVFTNKDLNQDYTYFVLQNDFVKKIIEKYTTGITIKHSSKAIPYIKIPLPSLSEQQKISFVLSKIQQAIEQHDKIIQITKELKKSLMDKLFTEGLHGEEQKETEIGLIPKSWETIEVDSLGEIVTGTTPPTKNKKYYEGGGFQFISPVDLGETKYAYKTEKEISSEGLMVSRVLPKDAVLVVCIGSTTGKVGLTFKEKSTTNQQINTIICRKEFNPHFVYYLLNFKSDYIRSLSTPSPVPILSKGKFQRAIIPITKDKQEQDEIAVILSANDEKIEKAESRKQTLQSLFKTMLNQLMTGRVRVKDLDIGVN